MKRDKTYKKGEIHKSNFALLIFIVFELITLYAQY